ncbi:MAG: glutamine--fructose-6-phosphate transaminase (isomerizing) [Candidatus Kapabacteria bacterium]|nr:glutamine--fructose-6-phosphate transaminase (isomerizing) [Candidatus Kapabacteria bacterium]MDW8012238.1 glutamine--fructose-6-phosphate transaminase (isomerizing) [Bacteroidota bacterium]
MCGIVGYIGHRRALPLLLNGLKRLEYRGYDSAGIAVPHNGSLFIAKRAGTVAQLEALLNGVDLPATVGIGHTRWATHGEPVDRNAHPHTDASGRIAIVHNGIIENHATLKAKLQADGYTFRSETDTEVLAVFIGALYEQSGDLELAVRAALSEVQGTFGLVVLSADHPEMLIAARRGSPIVIGVGDGEYIVASDATAIVEYTRSVLYLTDDETAILTRSGYQTKTIENLPTTPELLELEFDLERIEKGGFPHFMLKEIHEQPETFRDAFRGRLLVSEGNVKLGGLRSVETQLRQARRIIFTACGTSWHAALVGEYWIEELARLPVEVEYASEFRYRNPVLYPDDVVIAISQSGETADTLAAVREAKLRGATVLGIVNVVGSSIARETHAGVYIHAGPEIGVASTKAFTSQLAVLMLLALYLGRMRHLSATRAQEIAQEMLHIPGKIQAILNNASSIQQIAQLYAGAQNFLYLGRGVNFPVALEGALKMKEIAYIHAEGYPAAEMKHGPIALIDENMPVVAIAPKDELYDKVLSNIEEIRARRGKVIAITDGSDPRLAEVANHLILIPETLPILTPILAVIPLQLLAYYTAVERGCNVDMPRNLAKSVTVE